MNGFAQQAESMAEGFSKTVMSSFRYGNVLQFNTICDSLFVDFEL